MAMVDSWVEIATAFEEDRREIVLSGSTISDRIEKNGIDKNLYKLPQLNFLEISKTCLETVSPNICKLCNLTNLVLHHNKLSSLPGNIGQLSKLKFVDISGNLLESLPESLGELVELQSLNANCNKLKCFPNVSSLKELHIFDISHNELVCLPEGITASELSLLSSINARGNQITEIPAELSDLPSLKNLDVSDNKLKIIPAELSECGKLKEFIGSGNKLTDKRLGRMIDSCHTKSVLEYLGKILEKERAVERGKGGGKGKKDKKGKKKGKRTEEEEENKNEIQVLHYQETGGVTVRVKHEVANVRPHIVCCIIRNIDLEQSSNLFKRFITLQTKLHDTLCQKRQAATIATHNLSAVKAPLTFDARLPNEMKLVPLNCVKETTAIKMVAKLWHEAEEFRKEKKRNALSGIHKYLDLVKGQQQYPCLVDAEDTIISFPPITNCEKTKVTKGTKDILVEVSSSQDVNICKKILDEFLREMLEMGLSVGGQGPTDSCVDGAAGGDEPTATVQRQQKLIVEQVKITDSEGSLKVLYPARTDLVSQAFNVTRDYD